MSQIGRKPINVVEGVEIVNHDNHLSVKGKMGTLDFQFSKRMTINIKDNIINISRASDVKSDVEIHGLTRALLSNMITGVSEGYVKEMTLIGTGYTADASKGNFLLLNVGYSHSVYMQCPDGIKIETPKVTQIIIKGIDKQLVGQFAARVREVRKPEPYKGKGIRYTNEHVRKKAGKTVGGAS